MYRLLILHSRRFLDRIYQKSAWLSAKRIQVFIFISFFLSLSVNAEDLIKFDIGQQRADKAIIAFAQQTNQTIIFSYGLAKKYQTNQLKGYYTIRSGLKKLLHGTDLNALVEDSGQLSITYKKNNKNKLVDKSLGVFWTGWALAGGGLPHGWARIG